VGIPLKMGCYELIGVAGPDVESHDTTSQSIIGNSH
jgi:hypothetical protein